MAKRVVGSAAFKIVKGPRKLMTISEVQVQESLDVLELIDGLERGFLELELGEIQVPPRPEITIPLKGFSLSMPAWRAGLQICVKVVNVFEGNIDIGIPSHLAMINLFDPETGAATCVMDGTYITATRTAASAVLAARLLSRSDAKIATIVGAGVQAREHLRSLPLIRKLERINVCSMYLEDAQQLAATSEIAVAAIDTKAAVRESDIVCLATNAARPVIGADWVRPGTHISSVGYQPPFGELPRQLAEAHHLFVETLDALRPMPIGCGELAGIDPARATTLGAVVAGRRSGRRSDDEITVYKAMGNGMEDLIAANLVYATASRTGRHGVMEW